MKSISQKSTALFIIMLIGFLICACTGSGRIGLGPNDFTEYSALDAQQELREAQMEMIMYPIDDYYENLFEQRATEDAADALSEYLCEQYLLEQRSGE